MSNAPTKFYRSFEWSLMLAATGCVERYFEERVKLRMSLDAGYRRQRFADMTAHLPNHDAKEFLKLPGNDGAFGDTTRDIPDYLFYRRDGLLNDMSSALASFLTHHGEFSDNRDQIEGLVDLIKKHPVELGALSMELVRRRDPTLAHGGLRLAKSWINCPDELKKLLTEYRETCDLPSEEVEQPAVCPDLFDMIVVDPPKTYLDAAKEVFCGVVSLD
jgi:hypothetical protein